MTDLQKAWWGLTKAIFGLIFTLANMAALVFSLIIFFEALSKYYNGDTESATFSMAVAIFLAVIASKNKD